MLNLLIAFGCGAATCGLLYATHLLKLGESIVPGVLVFVAAYFVLARRTFKQVEKIVSGAVLSLQSMPPKFDLAIHTLETAYPLGKKQIGVTSQIDSQIGMIYFLEQQFSKALPYLQRAQTFGHWMGSAMLAVVYYKKKDHANMRKTMNFVVKRAKTQGLAWNLYAYLLQQIGDKDGAQKLLVEAVKKTKNDPRVKEALLALQNDKNFKMRVYKEQWYQFHLERPPPQQHPLAMSGRGAKMARRGRW